ncbi:MAG: hypothetical protein R2883_03735 [Caldisericia bacterium]
MGEKIKTYEIGLAKELPSAAELRSMGEKHCKSILTFNYLEDVPEKINVLNKEVSEYNVKMGSEVGAAEIYDSKKAKPGKTRIRYKSDLSCVLDSTTNTFTNWVMPDFVPYSPPVPTEMEIKNYRKLTTKVAEEIAIDFLEYMRIPIDGYKVSSVISETKVYADVYFFEGLADKEIKSPNWIKVKVNFWGMIKEYTLNIGPTPEISTEPTFALEDAIEVARKELAFPDDFEMPKPDRVILRTRFVENGTVYVKDELVWFFSFIGISGARRGTLMVSAHSGEMIED